MNGMHILAVLVMLLSLGVNGNQITRRRDFREAVRMNPDRVGIYAADRDPEIRRYALYLDFKKNGAAAVPRLQKALEDGDDFVRLTAVMALGSIADQGGIRQILSRLAREDRSSQVREVAVRASWPFYRKISLLSEDPSWDHDIVKVRSFQLPVDGWYFITDSRADGHWKGYYRPEHSLQGWRRMKIGYWEEQGVPDYDGVAWYRISFDMPGKIDCNAVEISFGAVDESAWIWLNGKYLGAHDLGASGWNMPFRVDCRKEVVWGGENILVVRVLDTNAGGGIWKPVHVDILK